MPEQHDGGHEAFIAALLDPHGPPPADIARRADGRAATRRFSVYRNNVIVSLTEYLAKTFPTVHALVGEEFFSAMAGVFVRSSPPRSPVLMEYGDEFAGFIAQFEPAAGLGYLADVARLENAQRIAMHAADAEPAGTQALAGLADADPDKAFLALHPSLQLVRSRWPVFAIRLASRGEHAGALPEAGEDVLVVRPRLDVDLHRLNAGMAELVGALAAGQPLGPALARATERASDFDPAHALALLFRAGAVVGVRTD